MSKNKKTIKSCNSQRFSVGDDPQSCHHCKNKKEFWISCFRNQSHRYCDACALKHFGIDSNVFVSNPLEYWIEGCPICDGYCPCIACARRLRNNKLQHNVHKRLKNRNIIKKHTQTVEKQKPSSSNITIIKKNRMGIPIIIKENDTFVGLKGSNAEDFLGLCGANEFLNKR